MKKIHFLAAMAAVSLASCSSSDDETVNNLPEGDAISFGSYINDQTRAMEKSAFSEGDVFGVNAFLNDGSTNGQLFTDNFMQNEELTKTSTGWSYVNTKFWPKNATDRVSFVAVYPLIKPTITDGQCAFDFTVNETAEKQTEFLWSTITDAHRDDRNGAYQNGILETPNTTPINNVLFHFRHGLSKIVFSAKAATYYSGTTITVTDITVNNLHGSGTYTLPTNLAKGTWTPTDGQTNGYTALSGGTTTVIDTYSRKFGQALLLMPQVLSTDGEAPSTVTIKYTVNYANPSSTVYEERTFNLATTALKDGNTWEQDKVYYYNFTIALDMITFDATIDSWSDSVSPEMSVN